MQRTDALLCRIDAQLGRLVQMRTGEATANFPPLDGGVLADLICPDDLDS